MLYVLDHYYAIDHPEFCLVIESDKDVNEIVEICSSIAFLLEELTDVSESLDMDCLLEILVTYYGAKNKKPDVPEEYLETLEMPIEGIYKWIAIAHDYICVNKAYIIDLYEARESCCGPNYRMTMEKWLPAGEQRNELCKLLLAKGVEK